MFKLFNVLLYLIALVLFCLYMAAIVCIFLPDWGICFFAKDSLGSIRDFLQLSTVILTVLVPLIIYLVKSKTPKPYYIYRCHGEIHNKHTLETICIKNITKQHSQPIYMRLYARNYNDKGPIIQVLPRIRRPWRCIKTTYHFSENIFPRPSKIFPLQKSKIGEGAWRDFRDVESFSSEFLSVFFWSLVLSKKCFWSRLFFFYFYQIYFFVEIVGKSRKLVRIPKKEIVGITNNLVSHTREYPRRICFFLATSFSEKEMFRNVGLTKIRVVKFLLKSIEKNVSFTAKVDREPLIEGNTVRAEFKTTENESYISAYSYFGYSYPAIPDKTTFFGETCPVKSLEIISHCTDNSRQSSLPLKCEKYDIRKFDINIKVPKNYVSCLEGTLWDKQADLLLKERCCISLRCITIQKKEGVVDDSGVDGKFYTQRTFVFLPYKDRSPIKSIT